MATFTNQSKSSSTFTNQSRTPSGITFADLPMSVLVSIAFPDTVLADGTIVADVTFETAVPGHLYSEYIATLWANQAKN